MNVIGDVRGMRCILVDDIVDSGGTLCNAADALLEAGAVSVQAYVTHGVLSGGAVARIAASSLERLVITDSIRPSEGVRVTSKVRVLTVAQLWARRSAGSRARARSPACSTEALFRFGCDVCPGCRRWRAGGAKGTRMTTVFLAERRERSGKGPARQLRREHKIPAIIYGGDKEPLRIAMPLKEIKLELSKNPRFFSTVFELDFGGERLKVLPREAQLHPVSDDPLHVDFLRAEQGAVIHVDVPVRFVHEDQSPGIKRGGVLNIVRRTLELICPADAIPGEIVVDLAGREIGNSSTSATSSCRRA